MATHSPSFSQAIDFGATVTAWYLFASLTPELRRVHTERSIANVQLLPILSMLASSACWVIYGCIVGNIFPLVVTTGVGCAFPLGYTAVYFHHADHLKRHVQRQFIWTIVGVAALALFCAFAPVSHHFVEILSGYMSVFTTAVMFASPLETLKTVVTERNAAYLPMGMVVSGFVSNALWVVSGVLAGDAFVIVPNVVNVALGVVQMALLVIYPRRPLGCDLETSAGHEKHKISEQTPLII